MRWVLILVLLLLHHQQMALASPGSVTSLSDAIRLRGRLREGRGRLSGYTVRQSRGWRGRRGHCITVISVKRHQSCTMIYRLRMVILECLTTFKISIKSTGRLERGLLAHHRRSTIPGLFLQASLAVPLVARISSLRSNLKSSNGFLFDRSCITTSPSSKSRISTSKLYCSSSAQALKSYFLSLRRRLETG